MLVLYEITCTEGVCLPALLKIQFPIIAFDLLFREMLTNSRVLDKKESKSEVRSVKAAARGDKTLE